MKEFPCRTTHSTTQDLLRLIDRIDATRVAALRIAIPKIVADNGVASGTVLTCTRLTRDAIEAGHLGYTLIIAERT